MSNTIKTNNPAPHAGETTKVPREGDKRPGADVPQRQSDPAESRDPAEADDPMAGHPDRQPGRDDPRQRPLTDNKAGG